MTTAQQLTTTIRSFYGLKTSRSQRSQKGRFIIASEIHRPCQHGDLPVALNITNQGIEYALQTGRLNGAEDIAIRAMNAWQYSALIGDVAANCSTMADTVSYLRARKF